MSTVKQFLGDLRLFLEDFLFRFKGAHSAGLEKIQFQIKVF